ncbi:MAG: DUF6033 family protein, partial [Butyrivibrio sp.]|nr:DUF6033 family protein [Butyrivibrio sp.]
DNMKESYVPSISKEDIQKKQAEMLEKMKKESYEKFGLNSETGIQEGVELSDKAKAVLEELKEKYGNIDFFVANDVSDENAQGILDLGSKEYSVLLDSDTLEAMAEDDEVKEKYMGLIDSSTQQLSDMAKELEESGQEVESLGVKIDSEGVATFFAKIKESNEAYKKKMDEAKEAQAKEEAKEAKEAEAKKAEEDRQKPEPKPLEDEETFEPRTATLSASSAEELLEMIKNYDWSAATVEE